MRRRLGPAWLALLGLVAIVVAPMPSAGARAPSGHDVHKIVDRNFPDPGILRAGNRYHLYATGPGFRVASSSSPEGGFVDHGASMEPEDYPSWFGRGLHGARRLWAPHVIAIPSLLGGTRYVMYFSASRRGGYDCIGVATSTSPTSGFVSADRPLVCGGTGGTVIDPAIHRSLLGQRYLVFKYRRISPKNNQIRAIRLSADGLSRQVGATSFRLVQGGTRVIEAPSVVATGGRVWLFVSRRNYENCTYSTHVFSARDITGDFRPAGPDGGHLVMRGPSGTPFCGPGGAEVIHDGEGHRIVFHAWRGGDWQSSRRARVVWTGRLVWGTSAPRLVR
jgi:hypothetical protein